MNISISDLLKQTNPNIIDIRSTEKYNNNHIPNAKNINSKDLLINPQKYLEKEKTYYLYCQHGRTSQKICQILNNQGYHTINILGGYEAWLLQQ